MSQSNDQEYYSARAVATRELAQRAAHPWIAAIHADLAARYDELAAEPEQRNYNTLSMVQAA